LPIRRKIGYTFHGPSNENSNISETPARFDFSLKTLKMTKKS